MYATVNTSLLYVYIITISISLLYLADCIDGHIRLDSAGLNIQESRNSSLTFGRVEVCFSGTYGTVDDNFWSNTEAAVVCRQLGISPYG